MEDIKGKVIEGKFAMQIEPTDYQISRRLADMRGHYGPRVFDYIVMNKKTNIFDLDAQLDNLYLTYGYEQVREVYIDVFFNAGKKVS
jgi:hypothetical protein